MPQSLDQFTRKLTDSGLISVDQLDAFYETVEPAERATGPEQLAQQLVDHNVLTEYQRDILKSEDSQPLVFGDYAILERVGEGGMGVVFRAKHRRMKRIVALKMLTESMVNDAAALRRFEREVELAAKLSHPNVVAALDAREENGVHYLIMEFVEGRDLTELIDAEGPQPCDKAIELVSQIAMGCGHAHSLGVIHRDIKPSNVLLDSNNVIKILDMGLARLQFAAVDGLADTQSQLTGAGVIMGTLDYISPEQALNAHRVDHRTDIYSLGCTLFYLLTGRAIYDGDTAMEKLVAHREEEIPSLSSYVEGVSDRLDLVYRKMVAKQPDDRYQSMEEVIEALQGALAATGGAPSQPDPVSAELVTVEVVDAEVVEPPSEPTPASIPQQFLQTHPLPRRERGAALAYPLIAAGRIAGAILGGFSGFSIGSLIGVLGATPAAIIYVWFGNRWGGGFAAVLAKHLGWSTRPPETIGGACFRPGRLRHLAVFVLVGSLAGWQTGDVWRGVFLALTVAALVAHRQRHAGDREE